MISVRSNPSLSNREEKIGELDGSVRAAHHAQSGTVHFHVRRLEPTVEKLWPAQIERDALRAKPRISRALWRADFEFRQSNSAQQAHRDPLEVDHAPATGLELRDEMLLCPLGWRDQHDTEPE
jgi:hypothetical protein